MAQPAERKANNNHLWSTKLILNQAYALAFACAKCNGIPRVCMNNDDGEILCVECAKEHEHTSPSKAVQKLINKLKTKCLSLMDDGDQQTDEAEGNTVLSTQIKDNQCDWTGMIQEYDQHGAQCPYVLVECSDCNTFKCKRKLLPQHTDQCPQVIIDCPLSCGSSIYRSNTEHHLDHDCMEKLLYCRNDDCKMQIKRKDLEHHVNNECETRVISCTFVQFGCTGKQIKAKDMKRHMDENKFKHLSNQFDHMKSHMTQENASLKDIITKLSNTVEDQQHQIDNHSTVVNEGLRELGITLQTQTNATQTQHQEINQLKQSLDAANNSIHGLTQQLRKMATDIENERKNNEMKVYVDVKFDRYDSRYIVIEQMGKRVRTDKSRCVCTCVYASTGFNSGIKQWSIKVVARKHGSTEQVGIVPRKYNGPLCIRKQITTDGGITSGTGLANGDVITVTVDFNTRKVTMLKNGTMLKDAAIDATKTYYPTIQFCCCNDQIFDVI